MTNRNSRQTSQNQQIRILEPYARRHIRTSAILLILLESNGKLDSRSARINSRQNSESLILASLSTISMSHMQDVILEKTFSLFNKQIQIYLNLESNFLFDSNRINRIALVRM